jgi:predicted transcriptional regulator
MNISEAFPQVAAAYVSNHQVRPEELPHVFRAIWSALVSVQPETYPHMTQPTYNQSLAPQMQPQIAQIEDKKKTPAEIRASLKNPDYIVSFVDNKPYKTLKKHLGLHGYTPESYRETFGLKPDYPIVAPNYSAARQAMALKMGLGRK